MYDINLEVANKAEALTNKFLEELAKAVLDAANKVVDRYNHEASIPNSLSAFKSGWDEVDPERIMGAVLKTRTKNQTASREYVTDIFSRQVIDFLFQSARGQRLVAKQVKEVSNEVDLVRKGHSSNISTLKVDVQNIKEKMLLLENALDKIFQEKDAA